MSYCTKKCPALLPEGSSYSHCTSCHLTFSGESAFDLHWKGRGDDRHCVPPQEVNLVPYDRSIGVVYGKPRMTQETREKLFKN
jgi:hypothetical protein